MLSLSLLVLQSSDACKTHTMFGHNLAPDPKPDIGNDQPNAASEPSFAPIKTNASPPGSPPPVIRLHQNLLGGALTCRS